MRQRNIDRRLQSICDSVPDQTQVLLDVGTDHGYVPIYLVKEGKIRSAIASDISAASLSKAEEEIRRSHLGDRIDTRVGSGLDVLQESDEVDTVVIAGMGGVLIAELLEKAKQWIQRRKVTFILQPVQGVQELREYLQKNHFLYIEELLVRSLNKFYQILVCEYCPKEVEVSYSSQDYYELSPRIVEFYTQDLVDYIDFRVKEMEKVVSSLEVLKNEKGLNEEQENKLHSMLAKWKFYEKVRKDALKGIGKEIG